MFQQLLQPGVAVSDAICCKCVLQVRMSAVKNVASVFIMYNISYGSLIKSYCFSVIFTF